MPFMILSLILSSVSAAGLADQTPVLQRTIDRCAAGGIVRFPEGTYATSTLQLKAHCTYEAAAGGTTLVLRAKNAFIFDISERAGITIRGLTFDAKYLGGAILAQGYAPVRDIHVETCRFRNVVSASTYPANLTIFSSWGIIDSSFTGNSFSNVAGGIALSTVQNVNIADNTFTDVTQSDAVFIAPNPVSFPSGDGLRIVNNRGAGFAKMAIEIFRPDPPNGSRLAAPVIEGNRFERFVARDGEGMGLSITHGENAVVRNNTIENTTGVHQENGIGIEIIVRGAQVTQNTVKNGFGYGIAVQGTREAFIDSNNITGVGKDGILFACDNGRNRCDSSGSRVENNVITNARFTGIHFQNRWTGSQVVNNTITRTSGSWPDDARISFEGIRESTPREGSTVRGNTITGNAAGHR